MRVSIVLDPHVHFVSPTSKPELWLSIYASVPANEFAEYYASCAVPPESGVSCEFVRHTGVCGNDPAESAPRFVNLPGNVDVRVTFATSKAPLVVRRSSRFVLSNTSAEALQQANYPESSEESKPRSQGAGRAQPIPLAPFAAQFNVAAQAKLASLNAGSDEYLQAVEHLESRLTQGDLLTVHPSWFLDADPLDDPTVRRLNPLASGRVPATDAVGAKGFQTVSFHTLIGATVPLGLLEDAAAEDRLLVELIGPGDQTLYSEDLKERFAALFDVAEVATANQPPVRFHLLKSLDEEISDARNALAADESDEIIDTVFANRVYALPIAQRLTATLRKPAAEPPSVLLRRARSDTSGGTPVRLELLLDEQQKTALDDVKLSWIGFREYSGSLFPYRESHSSSGGSAGVYTFVPDVDDAASRAVQQLMGGDIGSARGSPFLYLDPSQGITAEVLGVYDLPWDGAEARRLLVYISQLSAAGKTIIGRAPSIPASILVPADSPAKSHDLRPGPPLVRKLGPKTTRELATWLWKDEAGAARTDACLIWAESPDATGERVRAAIDAIAGDAAQVLVTYKEDAIFEFAQSEQAVEQIIGAEGPEPPASPGLQSEIVDDLVNYSSLRVWQTSEFNDPTPKPLAGDRQFLPSAETHAAAACATGTRLGYVFHYRVQREDRGSRLSRLLAPSNYLDSYFPASSQTPARRHLRIALQHTLGSWTNPAMSYSVRGHLATPVANGAMTARSGKSMESEPAYGGIASDASSKLAPLLRLRVREAAAPDAADEVSIVCDFSSVLECLSQFSARRPRVDAEPGSDVADEWLSIWDEVCRQIAELATCARLEILADLQVVDYRYAPRRNSGAVSPYRIGIQPLEVARPREAQTSSWTVDEQTRERFARAAKDRLSLLKDAATAIATTPSPVANTKRLDELRETLRKEPVVASPMTPIALEGRPDGVRSLSHAASIVQFGIAVFRGDSIAPEPSGSWPSGEKWDLYRVSTDATSDDAGAVSNYVCSVRVDAEPCRDVSLEKHFGRWYTRRRVIRANMRAEPDGTVDKRAWARLLPSLPASGGRTDWEGAPEPYVPKRVRLGADGDQISITAVPYAAPPLARHARFGDRTDRCVARFLRLIDDMINLRLISGSDDVPTYNSIKDHLSLLQASGASLDVLITKVAALYRPVLAGAMNASGSSGQSPTSPVGAAAPDDSVADAIAAELRRRPALFATAKAFVSVTLTAQSLADAQPSHIPSDVLSVQIRVDTQGSGDGFVPSAASTLDLPDMLASDADRSTRLRAAVPLLDDEYSRLIRFKRDAALYLSFEDLPLLAESKESIAPRRALLTVPGAELRAPTDDPSVVLPSRFRSVDPVILDVHEQSRGAVDSIANTLFSATAGKPGEGPVVLGLGKCTLLCAPVTLKSATQGVEKALDRTRISVAILFEGAPDANDSRADGNASGSAPLKLTDADDVEALGAEEFAIVVNPQRTLAYGNDPVPVAPAADEHPLESLLAGADMRGTAAQLLAKDVIAEVVGAVVPDTSAQQEALLEQRAPWRILIRPSTDVAGAKSKTEPVALDVTGSGGTANIDGATFGLFAVQTDGPAAKRPRRMYALLISAIVPVWWTPEVQVQQRRNTLAVLGTSEAAGRFQSYSRLISSALSIRPFKRPDPPSRAITLSRTKYTPRDLLSMLVPIRNEMMWRAGKRGVQGPSAPAWESQEFDLVISLSSIHRVSPWVLAPESTVREDRPNDRGERRVNRATYLVRGGAAEGTAAEIAWTDQSIDLSALGNVDYAVADLVWRSKTNQPVLEILNIPFNLPCNAEGAGGGEC